jgi:hypothetical protein
MRLFRNYLGKSGNKKTKQFTNKKVLRFTLTLQKKISHSHYYIFEGNSKNVTHKGPVGNFVKEFSNFLSFQPLFSNLLILLIGTEREFRRFYCFNLEKKS